MAITITLDGTTYTVYQNNYARAQRKIESSRRSLTGALDRTETGIFENRYQMTLICASAAVGTLRTSYSKSGSTSGSSNKLDFTDLENVTWNSASSGTGILNTGVYFDGDLQIRSLQGTGWGRSLVGVNLVAIATHMAAS